MRGVSAVGLFGRIVAAAGAVALGVSLFVPYLRFAEDDTYWDQYRRMDIAFLAVGIAALVLLAASLYLLRDLMLFAVAVLGGAGVGFFSFDFIESNADKTTGAFLSNLGSAAMIVGATIALLPALFARSGRSDEPAFMTSESPTAITPGPGWYTDPSGEARLRYWDGQAWTDQTEE